MANNTVQDEITRITTNVTNALTAIAAKGVTVPLKANSNNLAALIGSIPIATHSPTISVDYNGEITATCGNSSSTYQLSNKDDTDLIPANIQKGKIIFGVPGNLVVPEYKEVTIYSSSGTPRLKDMTSACGYMSDNGIAFLIIVAKTNTSLGTSSATGGWVVASASSQKKPASQTVLDVKVAGHANAAAYISTSGSVYITNSGTDATTIAAGTSVTITGCWITA